MTDVWVATNLLEEAEVDGFALIHADDVRHVRMVGEPRDRLVMQAPTGQSVSWVELVNSPQRYAGLSGLDKLVEKPGPGRPVLPPSFHRDLIGVLATARRRAAADGTALVVRAAVDDCGWRWRTEELADCFENGVPAARAS